MGHRFPIPLCVLFGRLHGWIAGRGRIRCCCLSGVGTVQWSEGRGQRRTAAIARAPATAAADGRTEIGCPRSCTTFKMPIEEREGGGTHTCDGRGREGGGTGRAMRRAGSGDPSEQRTNPLLAPSFPPPRQDRVSRGEVVRGRKKGLARIMMMLLMASSTSSSS